MASTVVVFGCLAFAVMTHPTWCVSVVMESKSEGVIELERGGWHMTLVEWLSTPLERPSHKHHLCGGWMRMESTVSEKQEGTHGGCCGCEVAHCGSSTPSKHPSSGASQNNTLLTLVFAFPPIGITTERRERVVVSE